MPFAKGVSAKSHDFDDEGNETNTDYRRMMKIVLDAGYHGYVGIEYEGRKLPEPEGIRKTKALLERSGPRSPRPPRRARIRRPCATAPTTSASRACGRSSRRPS